MTPILLLTVVLHKRLLGSSLSGIPPLPLALDEGRGPAALDEGPAEESGEPCGLSCGELSNPSLMRRASWLQVLF